MIKKIIIFIWGLIKRTYLFKICEWFYGKAIHILFAWKWLSLILAYGGVHMIVLIVLGYKAYHMWNDLNQNNVISFNQIIYHFYGDTLHNYRINHLAFEKDMRRRSEVVYNPNDINYTIGFSKSNTKVSDKVSPVKTKWLEGECDLASKIKYITCNNLPDSIKKKVTIYNDTVRKIVYKTQYYSNHERDYYDMSLVEGTPKLLHHVTNAKDHLIEWDSSRPCFSFWLGIIVDNCDDLDDSSVIRIKFNNFEKNVTRSGYKKPIIIENISPAPTESGLREVVFKGKELKNVIKQRGIFVSGVDQEKKEIIEKQNLRSTVLLGTIIAFMLDIMVQLIIKWRRLKDYKKNEKE